MTTSEAVRLFMNKGTYAGVALAIIALVFAGVVYLVEPESADFIMNVIGVVVVPLCTALVLGPPIKDIAHNTDRALNEKLESQTSDIVTRVASEIPSKDGETNGK